MGKYLLAHDLGTSGNKATLFSLDGEMVKSVVCSYGVHFFNGNWAEQNPDDWWQAICDATKQLVQDINAKDVLAVSFSGQMMGCLPVDKNGKPLCNSIIWADMRASKQEAELLKHFSPQQFYHKVGHPLSGSYSLEKLMWVRDNKPDVFEKCHMMLQAKDYIVYRMTGEFLTDYSDASGTNAFDLNTNTWSDEILAAAGIDKGLLPTVAPSTHVAGKISASISEECGLATGTLVVLGGGDGSCASAGAGSIAEGITYNCLGSSSWISSVSKNPVYDDLMRTVTWAHVIPGLFIPSGTMQTAGAAFNWAMEKFCVNEIMLAKQESRNKYDLVNAAIEKSPAGANGLLFLPYLLGERCPRWNIDARGTFVGLKMEHTTGDIMRSVFEGVAMNLEIILGILKKSIDIKEMILVGGLAQGSVQQQIFADIYGMQVQKLTHVEEATSIGAAVIAGVGAGLLEGFESVSAFNQPESTKQAITANVASYAAMKPLFENSYQALLPVYDALAKL